MGGRKIGLGADLDDGIAVDEDGAVLDVGVCGIARDDAAVANKKHHDSNLWGAAVPVRPVMHCL